MPRTSIDQLVPDRSALDSLARAYAESKSGLIFFVGSGPSTDAGLPDWKALRTKLTQHAEYLVTRNAISNDIKGSDLQALKAETDYWKAFSLLKKILGNTSYPARMRELLTPPPTASIPAIYSRIAEFQIRGVITTNIDDLLLRAVTDAVKDLLIKPVYGKDISDRLEILLRERPFFLQMHGNISAERTWVFTNEELEAIRGSAAHSRFLDAVYFTSTVVFIGISADDVAVTGRLVEMRNSDLFTTPHYWITPDINSRKRDWAEANGIQQIVYSSAHGHEKCVNRILDYIKSYRSVDPVIDDVSINARGAAISEADPIRLAGLEDIDSIRQSLNGIILSHQDNLGKVDFARYSDICKKYKRAVATAYLLPDSDEEKWFGYSIDRTPLGGRTFGNVYSGTSPEGDIAAIKILQQRRFQDSAYLSAFRRGAEALRILERYRVDGVVRLLEAYELPPTLIMKFENGASLDQLVPSSRITPDAILKVFKRCAAILKAGHGLPQTVMHRDIKPSNIMLRNFSWQDSTFDDVVMFDFDLGWYKGADGEEVARTDPESLGFQAPEQLQAGKDASRRSTLVDSFGLGITLYYCLSGVVPSVGATMTGDWQRRVDGACRRAFPGDFVAAKRCARLILNATLEEQRRRPDSSMIYDDLDDLVNWRKDQSQSCSTEFVAEAIASLATEGEYVWDENKQGAFYTFPSGMSIKTAFNPIDNRFVLEFRSEDTTDVNRKNVNQRLSDLPSFVAKEVDKIGAESHNACFVGVRQIEGAVKWEPSIARVHIHEIGKFARSVGRWLSAL